jgi:glycine cleavage system aminomethyltransferase T
VLSYWSTQQLAQFNVITFQKIGSWRLRGAVQESYLTMLLNEKAGIIDDCIVCNDLKS